jgi:hypothetical protein
MASRPSHVLPFPKAAIGFKPEHLDFRRGIHVGNLADNERITRILKLELEYRYGEPFVTERYGRGVYWQWIGYLPRRNREAKPVSSGASFSCSKFFLMVDTEEELFKCGLQVERGRTARRRGRSAAARPRDPFTLAPDWDWHRLVKSLSPGGAMERELNRLIRREGFLVRAGSWSEPVSFSRAGWPGVARLKKSLQKIGEPDDWTFFQLYYAIREPDVKISTGVDLVESMLAVLEEVTPAMNLTMQTRLVIGQPPS